MHPTDYQRACELFYEVFDLPPVERQKVLLERNPEPNILAELEFLLTQSGDDQFSEANLGAANMAIVDSLEKQPERIGPYEILALIGEGGMGSVYKAEQLQPIHRTVALKVVKLGMDSRAILRRFEQERQALAVMSHDAIARVYDAGATDTGQPYFAMEYIDGERITSHCDRHALGVPARLRLMQRICDAVQHAHQKGVLHRDLKPSNIMASLVDVEHIIKVIDFGLARATQPDPHAQSWLTEHGVFCGTPEYMSPEQAAADPTRIDTRSDIYSLGVVLYEILTGELPIDAQALHAQGMSKVPDAIRELEPPRPSTRLTTIADAKQAATKRCTSPTALRRLLRGDLDWIVMKAIAKEPELRYDSAGALARDIGRYL